MQTTEANRPHRGRREARALVPFYRPEAITARQAALKAGVSVPTMRVWVERHALGSRLGGTILVSVPALTMHLENDRVALGLYHQGKRTDPRVAHYFERCGIDASQVFGEDR